MIIKKYKFLLIALIIGGFIGIYNISKDGEMEKVYLEEINDKIETNSYFAILEIPEIDLKREIFPIDSENNDVENNLFITSNSTFPNNDNESNIIIAAHSGDGKNAYFKYLYKMNIDNEFYLYYNGSKYTYIIREIEYQDKTGTLYLKSDYSNMITLITCTKDDNKTQTIYYAELEKM